MRRVTILGAFFSNVLVSRWSWHPGTGSTNGQWHSDDDDAIRYDVGCDAIRKSHTMATRADVESRTDWKVAEQSNQTTICHSRSYYVTGCGPGQACGWNNLQTPDWTVLHDDDDHEAGKKKLHPDSHCVHCQRVSTQHPALESFRGV